MKRSSMRRFLESNGRRVLFFSVGGAVLVALIVTTVLVTRARRAAATSLYMVKKGTLRIVITEDGVLRAKESQKVIADIEAQAKIVSIVEEGRFVTEGTTLVELDKTQLTNFLESLELELISLEANYTNAQGQLKYVEAESPQQLEKLKFDVEKAQARLDKAKAQRPTEDQEHLYSESELRDAQIAVDEARMNLDTAGLARELYEKYTAPQNLREAKANLEKAERLYNKQKEQEAKVKEQLKKMELVAPSDGLVVYGTGSQNPRRRAYGEEEIKVGANVYKGQVVITLPNVTKMQVEISIHEVDIHKVERGMPTTIRVHAFPNQEFEGTVFSKGALAHERDGWRSQGVKVFDVAVDIAGKHTRMRPGMTARVDILVNEIPDVLMIPIEAVFIEPAKAEHYCYVRTPSGPEKRLVELDASNNSYVVVTKGLKEKEQVYQYDPTAKIE